MICSVPIVLHLSLVPSIQFLICLWFPGPHVGSFPIASQIPSLIHCPSCISFTQLGSSVPASTQEIVLIVSAAVHLSLVPSIQVLICFWSPGPHVKSSPIALHSPLFVHSPSCFVVSIRICQKHTTLCCFVRGFTPTYKFIGGQNWSSLPGHFSSSHVAVSVSFELGQANPPLLGGTQALFLILVPCPPHVIEHWDQASQLAHS